MMSVCGLPAWAKVGDAAAGEQTKSESQFRPATVFDHSVVIRMDPSQLRRPGASAQASPSTQESAGTTPSPPPEAGGRGPRISRPPGVQTVPAGGGRECLLAERAGGGERRTRR